MSWRIEYDMKAETCQKDRCGKRFLLTMGFLVLFCLMVSFFWPEGQDMLRILLIPGDPEVTLEAAEVFARQLHQGFSVGEAARNFCMTVLNNEAAAGY